MTIKIKSKKSVNIPLNELIKEVFFGWSLKYTLTKAQETVIDVMFVKALEVIDRYGGELHVSFKKMTKKQIKERDSIKKVKLK
jgi:hypothetical protein